MIDERNSLYGSIHTHFESDKDAVNAHFNEKGKISFQQALGEFYKLGAKKVAVTEHGAFNSFEDLYNCSLEMKKDGQNIDVIPGCEVYFDYNSIIKTNNLTEETDEDVEKSHLILIAKDYEGYLQLCKIISDSNKNIQVGKTKDYPIVTKDILDKYIKDNPGHLIATSACIAGPLCETLSTNLLFLKEKVEQYEAKLNQTNYFSLMQKKKQLNDLVDEIKNSIPYGVETKAAINKLKKEKVIDAAKAIELVNLLQEAKEKLDSPEINALKNEILEGEKSLKANKLTRTINNYQALLLKYQKVQEQYSTGINIRNATEIYNTLYELFKNDFYFEIQNHHLDNEKEAYNKLVQFAIDNGNPQFIASNDIHIAMHKDNPKFKSEVRRRKVARYNAIKKYPVDTIDEYEYGIKTDNELREELLSIIKPYKDFTSEQIVDNAISNIQGALEQCKSFEVKKEDHYPKFADNDNELFEKLIKEGLAIKFPNGFPEGKEEEYQKRLDKEINIIESMGYASYHLIVQDYLEYGRLLGYLPPELIEYAPNDKEQLKQIISDKIAYIKYLKEIINIVNALKGMSEEFKNLNFSKKVVKEDENIHDIKEDKSVHDLYECIENTTGLSIEDISSRTVDDLVEDINLKLIKQRGYSIGPGRGSAAGSLACYLLGITDIDPIKYNLLFERFLNPERKSMPDIDSDFRRDIRDKCIDYCADKYGSDNICRIMTKTYQSSKGAIRLAARYLGSKEKYDNTIIELDEEIDEDSEEQEVKETDLTKKWYKIGDNICKYIDEFNENQAANQGDNKEKEVYLNKLEEKDIEFEDYIDPENEEEQEIIDDGSIKALLSNPNFTEEEREVIRVADDINGMFTATGEHACGVIISKDNITDIIPLMHNKKMDNFSTQCTMAQAEAKGLLKMDFLGLKNLDIITNVLKQTDDEKLQDYTIRDEILNDPKIYKTIYCTGNTLGIFQFESPGMTKLLSELQPDCFEDIIAAISLYRPGPMQFIPSFIEGKHNPESVTYKCDKLKEILSPTYGTIVYQEQVMAIFQGVGYTLGGADAIRKAMGKKHIEDIEAERNNFIFGNEERGINGAIKEYGMSKEEANTFFDTMVEFGKYAFNKSHATAYAMVSLFTAYLKTYHPAEFYKETLKYLGTKKRSQQFNQYIAEMNKFGVTMEAPNLLVGNMEFENIGNKIYFGLAEGKDMSAFEMNKKTDCLQDFVINNPHISSSILNKLIRVGCFKSIWTDKTMPYSKQLALNWVKEVKPKYDDCFALKNAMVSMKQKYQSTLDEKEKEKILKSFGTKKEKYYTIIKEIEDLYNTFKTLPIEEENKLLRFKDEKDLCYTVLSAKDDIKYLINSKNTFSDLDNAQNPLIISAIVVGISDEMKTKSTGNIYYNVDLMDKTGIIRTVRFKEKPSVLIGDYRIPKEWYFNATVYRSLEKASTTSVHSFKDVVNKVINKDITIDSITDVDTKRVGNNDKKFVIQVDKALESSKESDEANSLSEDEKEID